LVYIVIYCIRNKIKYEKYERSENYGRLFRKEKKEFFEKFNPIISKEKMINL